jgi:hypothetical protein
MATGSLSITITLPTTNAIDPATVSAELARQLLAQASQQIVGAASSGNLTYQQTLGNPTVVGTWSYAPATS